MQNLVVFMEASEDGWDTSLNYGNMIFNRFCIDEDAAFELSEVIYFQTSSRGICYGDNVQNVLKRKVKGQEYTFPYHKVSFYFDDSNFKSICTVSRFYMEEDRKGRGKEKFPLSLNIITKQWKWI